MVNQRSQENVISDGADLFKADVEQSATEIQVSLHKKLFCFSLRSHVSLYGLFITVFFLHSLLAVAYFYKSQQHFTGTEYMKFIPDIFTVLCKHGTCIFLSCHVVIVKVICLLRKY